VSALRSLTSTNGHAPDLADRPPVAHRAVLHGLLDSDPVRRIDAIDTVAHELGATAPNRRALAERLAPAAAIPQVVVHNDVHEAQIMIGPDGVTGLIDWQTASITPPTPRRFRRPPKGPRPAQPDDCQHTRPPPGDVGRLHQ
jgi:hypothetical protein